MFKSIIGICIAIAIATTASAQSYWGGGGYQQEPRSYGGGAVVTGEARQGLKVVEATVVDIAPLVIEKSANSEARNTGRVVGGLIGAAAGNGNWARSAVFGALGALAGGAVADKAGEKDIVGVQIIVRRQKDGELFSFNQQVEDGVEFRAGDKVYVIGGNGQSTRIIRASADLASYRQAPAQTPARWDSESQL